MARREGTIMMYAELGFSAVLLVVLGGAGRAAAARLRRIRGTGGSGGRREPPRKTVGTHSAARDYPASGATNSKGLRLAIERSHARRVERRREKREFQAWLEITSQPL
ncbi:hypothetical protein OS122_02000 [Mycolicibacterium mucogenicum]|uniref:hypothetical protein n=1 Tax=Mycolicibacterium TaxID=1866885 RepID=UPI00226AA395|nr:MULTISPECIES: hypothetical protein [Mycolicibacterium]MCX8559671.1 hypothetical protein [Mycolicibacterium mucogenicum]